MAAILQNHLAAHGGHIFSAYFSVNGLLHISINYTENVTNLYAHAQTVVTRRSSPILQVPGYKAITAVAHVLNPTDPSDDDAVSVQGKTCGYMLQL